MNSPWGQSASIALVFALAPKCTGGKARGRSRDSSLGVPRLLARLRAYVDKLAQPSASWPKSFSQRQTKPQASASLGQSARLGRAPWAALASHLVLALIFTWLSAAVLSQLARM